MTDLKANPGKADMEKLSSRQRKQENFLTNALFRDSDAGHRW